MDRSKALSEFLLEYMNSASARNLFRARAKFTTNLAHINSGDFWKLPLPVPVQQAMIKRVEAGRAEIANLRADTAKANLKAVILGTKSVQ